MPVAACLAAGLGGVAAQMAQAGRQLPSALLDEAQDAVASLYLLLQVGCHMLPPSEPLLPQKSTG